MALLKYLKRVEPSADEQVESVLPKPNGTLSLSMPSSSIAAANSEVRKITKDNKGKAGSAVEGSTSTIQKRKRLKLRRKHWSVALYALFHITQKLIQSEHFHRVLCTPGKPNMFESWPKDEGRKI